MVFYKPRLLLGAHISIAGGFYKAIERAESIGCTTIQIFTKSNRQWFAKPLIDEEIEQFNNARNDSPIQSVIAHASYLINICSPDNEIRNKSIRALKEELERCEKLAIPYLVLHPGSSTSPESTDFVIQGLDHVLSDTAGSTMILLETMAGQGSNLCYQFEQIAQIRKSAHHKKRIGVCFDTCHAFAAGYALQTHAEYAALWTSFDALIGLEHLKVIHINDSKKDCGSRVDRHEHIGKGKIGAEFFRLLFNDPRFFAIPKILETPKETLKEDLINMQFICTLLNDETKKKLEIIVPNDLS